MESSIESSSDDSVNTLLTKLCQIELCGEKKCHLVQPHLSKKDKVRRLRINAYNALFHHLNGPHRYHL